MKQSVLISLFFLSGLIYIQNSLYSQETSLLPDNMKWTEVEEYEGPMDFRYFVTRGDTIIDNIRRNKLYFRWRGEYSEEMLAAFFHLEDKKIIVRSHPYSPYPSIYNCIDSETDYVLYDFNLLVGDSVLNCSPNEFTKVEIIDSVYVGNSYKKKYCFDSYFGGCWIEDIGSTRELFAPLTDVFTGYPMRSLACVSIDDEVIYLNDRFDKCPEVREDSFYINLLHHQITFCSSDLPQFILSRFSPIGGTYPFTYTWSGSIQDENGEVHPTSHFLNDTTMSNPILFNSWGNNLWNQFILEVKDSNGRIAKDSVRVRFSEFYSFPAITTEPIYISLGDSILFDARNIDIGGICPYVSYEWIPRDWLSHSDSSVTWCKPEASKEYICMVTDSFGCQNLMGSIIRTIVVNPASISSETAAKNVYQSGETVFFENPEAAEIVVSFYDFSGKLIHKEQTTGNSYRPDLLLPSGIYVCRVKYEHMEKSIKYIVKEYNR